MTPGSIQEQNILEDLKAIVGCSRPNFNIKENETWYFTSAVTSTAVFPLFLEFERNKLRDQLTLGPHPNDSATELELSEESDNNAVYSKSGKPRNDIKSQG